MENCKNSQEYKAGKAAAEWWQTLSEEQRKQMDIVDAFAYGVLHGWNNPNWISVEEQLPEVGKDVLVWSSGFDEPMVGFYMYRNWQRKQHMFYVNNDRNTWGNITHWMPLPTPPQGKEDKGFVSMQSGKPA